MTGQQLLAYRCAPTIAWVKDATQTILVEEEEGRSWSLQGLEAVIWDLLGLRYSQEKITRFLTVLLGCSGEEAEEELFAIMLKWEKSGVVCVVKDSKGD